MRDRYIQSEETAAQHLTHFILYSYFFLQRFHMHAALALKKIPKVLISFWKCSPLSQNRQAMTAADAKTWLHFTSFFFFL